MLHVRHVLALVEKDTFNLVELIPQIDIVKLDGLRQLVYLAYDYERNFNPAQVWNSGHLVAPIDLELYAQLTLGESVDYLKTTGYMPLSIEGLKYLGCEIIGMGPSYNEVKPASPRVTIALTFKSVDIYFLGVKNGA